MYGFKKVDLKEFKVEERKKIMTIKEIRALTGLTQVEFGNYYNIPLPTIKKWESSEGSQNYRECPVYVNQLLEKAVRIDFKRKIAKANKENHLIEG
ncbi:MAG: hypothetical protein EOM34_09140 [Clostridia bacterium]|nr:hypothetical protein [Lachnospiraceae bacterium]NCC00830.1 hypothetical protein [Clostridia bacterium]NCD02060.1 hypothetical protein [Clostridia bacterium]